MGGGRPGSQNDLPDLRNQPLLQLDKLFISSNIKYSKNQLFGQIIASHIGFLLHYTATHSLQLLALYFISTFLNETENLQLIFCEIGVLAVLIFELFSVSR